MKYFWKRRQLICWILGSILAWHFLGQMLSKQAAIIGPEHFTRVTVKLFDVMLACWLTTHVDSWLSPKMAEWAKRNFDFTWKSDPSDPRIKLCVMFRCITFAALCLLFAL